MSHPARRLACIVCATVFAACSAPAEHRTTKGLEPPQTRRAALAPFELDESSRITGRVQFVRCVEHSWDTVPVAAPKDDPVSVVLFVTGEAMDVDFFDGQGILGWNGESSFAEVARASVAEDGTFDLPRVKGDVGVCLRVESDFAHDGSWAFWSGGEHDPGNGPVVLEAIFGACVTVELVFPRGTTTEETALLLGRRIAFVGDQPGGTRFGFDGALFFPVDETYTIVARGAPPWRLDYERDLRPGESSSSDGLLPFVNRAPLHFDPERGERIVVRAVLERSAKRTLRSE